MKWCCSVVTVVTWLYVLQFSLLLSLWCHRTSGRVTEVVAVAFRGSCHTAMSHVQDIRTFWSTSCSHSSKKFLLKKYITQISYRLTAEGSSPSLRYCHLIQDCRMVNLCSVAYRGRLKPATRIPLQLNHTETPTHIEPRTTRPMW